MGTIRVTLSTRVTPVLHGRLIWPGCMGITHHRCVMPMWCSLTKVCDMPRHLCLAIQLRTQQHLFLIFRWHGIRRSNGINNSSCLLQFSIAILFIQQFNKEVFLPDRTYYHADFYSTRTQLHCKRCISYGNSVRLSVCLSHAGIVSKRQHVARCSLHRWIAKCV